MSISYMRTWEDTDAPGLTRVVGSFITMIKKVLVEGYGTTPGLGWELIWEQADKIVFRNQGTRMFVRFHQTSTYEVDVKSYEAMSDIDTGQLECPNPNLSVDPFRLTYCISYANVANLTPWLVLGDEKGIWIGWRGYYSYNNNNIHSAKWKFVYIGDYINYDSANTVYNFCMLAPDSYTSSYDGRFHCDSYSTSRKHYHAMRGIDLSPGAICIGLSSGSRYTGSVLGNSDDISKPEDPIQHTSIPEIHIPGTALLGRLPGLKNSLSDSAHGSSLAALNENRPELLFDFGDYKEHFFRYDLSFYYIVLTEGKGFRDVI